MSKTCLIAGCSHTAGSEIDGDTDSPFNRQHSYGNLLANKLGYTPINIAVSGYTNSAIARSVLEYCSEHDTSDLSVVIGWSESSRIEAPFAIQLGIKKKMESIVIGSLIHLLTFYK